MLSDNRIVIFSRNAGWHTGRLVEALAVRGMNGVCVPLDACSIATEGGVRGLSLPGFEDKLPRGAIVRTISAGSFEQVTFRLGVLHALRGVGVRVCNDARAIECCVDKSMTSFLLSRAGLPTPATWVCESASHAMAIAEKEIAAGRTLVLKPLFGAQGRGQILIEGISHLPAADELSGVYYFQQYIHRGDGRFYDWRVFVVGNRAVAAMIRRGTHWLTNVGRGARCEAVIPEGELGDIAVAAANAVGARVAGVDIVRDVDGRPFVLEVNSMPAWQGLQGVSRIDLAQAIVDDFLAWLEIGTPMAPARETAVQ